MLRSGGFRASSSKYSVSRDRDDGVGLYVLSEAHVSVRSMLTSLPIRVCVLWLLNSARRHDSSRVRNASLSLGVRGRGKSGPAQSSNHAQTCSLRCARLVYFESALAHFPRDGHSSLRSSCCVAGKVGRRRVRTARDGRSLRSRCVSLARICAASSVPAFWTPRRRSSS